MALHLISRIQTELLFTPIVCWLLLTTVTLTQVTLFSRLKCLRAILLCLLMAVTYVGSLYVWQVGVRTGRQLTRDHEAVIKRRFISVTIASIYSCFVLSLNKYVTGDYALTIWETMGFRTAGILPAIIFPLLLTMVLFSGPLVLNVLDGLHQLYLDPRYWWTSLGNSIWLRNHVVAPVTEELTFRSCMIPLLVPCLGLKWAIIASPLFFGVAHFHHLLELLRQGYQWQQAVLNCLFQFLYTTVFGIYSAFLFARTGHFLASCIVHAFCNHMGVPNFSDVLAYKQPTRSVLIAVSVAGTVAWYYLLFPLTTPHLYKNPSWVE